MTNRLSFYKENTVTIDLNFTDVDLTGATVYFTLKSDYDDDATDSTALISKDVTVHTNPTAGETAVILTPTDTNITPGNYYYDVKLEKASGEQQTIQIGRCKVLPAVTNRG
jgi:hypothetical protein